MNLESFSTQDLLIIFLIFLWTLPWKGIALWRVARNKQVNWFIAILILNTFAILEITYLFFFQKNKNK